MLSDDEKIAACVIANDEKVEGYADALWQIDSDEVIVLHVLAVHPDHRGKGLARRLVENVIEEERKPGLSYAHFAERRRCCSKNPLLCIYQKSTIITT